MGSHRGPAGTWGDQEGPSALAVPAAMGCSTVGQGLAFHGSPAGSCGRSDTTVWGANISRHVVSVEGVQLRRDPWLPGAQLEHIAQGKVVQPGLRGCTSELHPECPVFGHLSVGKRLQL